MPQRTALLDLTNVGESPKRRREKEHYTLLMRKKKELMRKRASMFKESTPIREKSPRSMGCAPEKEKMKTKSKCAKDVQEDRKSSFMRDMSSIRDFLFNESLADVRFIFPCGGKVTAHRIVLCLRSVWFQSVFEMEGKSGVEGMEIMAGGDIAVTHLSLPIFKALLEWIYTDSFTVAEDTTLSFLLNLFMHSHHCRLVEMHQRCCDLIERRLNEDNVLEVTSLCYSLPSTPLRAVCISFVSKLPMRAKEALILKEAKDVSALMLKDLLLLLGGQCVLCAVRLQREDVLTLLIESGQSVDTPDKRGRLPLEVALKTGGSRAMVAALINQSSGDVEGSGESHLHMSVRRSDVMQTQLLMDSGADLNARNRRGLTALHLACKGDDVQMVHLLLSSMAASNFQDDEGNTPLHLTTQESIARLLLMPMPEKGGRHRSNPAIPNHLGQTPLHLASRRGDVQVMLSLINAGASLSTLDDMKRSPLHEAAASGLPATVLILLQNQDASAGELLDANAQDVHGDTPLHLAAPAWTKQVGKVMHALLEAGARVTHTNQDGRTALHMVAGRTNKSANDAALVALLLSYGADMHVADKQGSTALHLAVQCGNESVATTLVTSGASLSSMNSFGDTPLDLATPSLATCLLRSIKSPPMWVKDQECPSCQNCTTSFSVTLRRHHCRHCGRAVCGACSGTKIVIEKFNGKKRVPVRVCTPCHSVLTFTTSAAITALSPKKKGDFSWE